MVVPAMQLASKIPDMSVQLWSSALLRGMNTALKQPSIHNQFKGDFIGTTVWLSALLPNNI